jgi:hypothetical protein
MRITAGQPDGCRIDQIEVPVDQFAKGCFRTSVRVIGKQCSTVRHGPSLLKRRCQKKSDKKSSFSVLKKVNLRPQPVFRASELSGVIAGRVVLKPCTGWTIA